MIGDAHLYINHIDQAKTQIERVAVPFPTIKIAPAEPRDNVWDYVIDDFVVENYFPKPFISAKMAI